MIRSMTFPTPPWATRALLKHVLIPQAHSQHTVLEPACGRGHMAKTLSEYFHKVTAFDIADYGYKRALQTRDFLEYRRNKLSLFDWVITNPPFNKAEKFVHNAVLLSRVGAAIFIRSTFAESVGRYERLFQMTPPTTVAQFSERVVLHKGKLSPKGSTATAYCWMVWNVKHYTRDTRYVWIPPCRAKLEHPKDYR
jgi:type I restriction-modification system DNA methylase subunit